MHQRVLTLQGVPTRLRGALRTAFRAGLQLIADRESPVQELRGWKLFCLAPRMFLHRFGGDSLIPPAELDRRCDLFARGAWPELLSAGSAASRPRSAAPRDDLAARAARATALVHIGELSAAGRALVAEPLAPGTAATLAELRTLRDAPRLPTRRCRKTSPRSEPTVPVPCRSQRSLRACGLPGAGRQPGR